jgi:hypothetical protein
MLGAAGFVLPEAFNRSGAVCGPEAVWFKVKICWFFFHIRQTLVLIHRESSKCEQENYLKNNNILGTFRDCRLHLRSSDCWVGSSFLQSVFEFIFASIHLWAVPQTGALLLDGNTLSYFGANIPVNLAFAVISEVILVGGAEYYRSTNKSPLGSVNVFYQKYPSKCCLQNLCFQLSSYVPNSISQC